jgi:peptidoglycan L-alanyl-D-glutamate endopeptidase CwlK
MPKFGKRSKKNFADLHNRLQFVLKNAIDEYDFSIICGHRSKSAQNRAYKRGKSKLKYPDSKHNQFPSLAVDVAPYPVDWNDAKRFYYLAGLLKGIASDNDIELRWGGDWDSDGDFNDQNFNDLCHFELINVGGTT